MNDGDVAPALSFSDDLFDVVDAGRSICEGCCRPLPTCLCAAYPPQPIATRGAVVILRHPLERRCALNTAPLLLRCLRQCFLLDGRSFVRGLHPIAGTLLDAPPEHRPPILLLYPTAEATDLRALCCEPAVVNRLRRHHDNRSGEDVGRPLPFAPNRFAYVLVVMDGTWAHTAEMVRASPDLVAAATPVRLALSEEASCSSSESAELPFGPLGLRLQKDAHGMHTAEAVGRAVALLEVAADITAPAESDTVNLFLQTILSPLRLWVRKMQQLAARGT